MSHESKFRLNVASNLGHPGDAHSQIFSIQQTQQPHGLQPTQQMISSQSQPHLKTVQKSVPSLRQSYYKKVGGLV